MPSVSVGAYTVATQSKKPDTVKNYTPIGIIGANTWHGQLVYQAFDWNGSSAIVTLRNLSGSTISTTGSVKVLYALNMQYSISRVSTSPKQLWSGSKSSGSITVSNSTKYSLFVLNVSSADDHLFGVRPGTSGSINFTANPAWANNSASQIAVAGIRFTTNGDTWTFNGMGRYNLENNYSYGLGNVTSIYGIVQHSISHVANGARIYSGSTIVIGFGEPYVNLFSGSEIKKMIGRNADPTKDSIFVCNGDIVSDNFMLAAGFRFNDSNPIKIFASENIMGQIRINWVYIAVNQYSISPTTLWSGKVSSGTIRLSESIYNYSVVGFWTCSGGSDDAKDRLVLCGVTPNMTFISGGSCGMSNSDIRDIRVGFSITSATTLTYVNVIRTMLYTNEWTVQGISYNRNVFGVVGVVKA